MDLLVKGPIGKEIDLALETVLLRLREADKSALNEIFEANYPAVCATIFRFINDKDISQDLAQRVFIRFWEKREEIIIVTSLSAYLRRMAVNEALAWIRLKYNQPKEELSTFQENSSDADAAGNLLYEELKEQINHSILSLPPRCRAVFLLSRYEEMTYLQIAKELDISIKTVEHQMGKALRLLRQQLEPYLSSG